jgi:RNA polymerase sigma-70 factor, ECF subfamily
VEKQHGLELAEAFYAASRSGNMKALGAMQDCGDLCRAEP